MDVRFSSALNIVGINIFMGDDKGGFVLIRTKWIFIILDIDIGVALGLLTAMQWVRDLH